MIEERIESFNILLVEDNEDDIIIIERIFKKSKQIYKLNIVRNGCEALDYIYHREKYAEEKPVVPNLILLDIAMPRLNGFEVLKALKKDPKYKKIPVIMLTTSNRENDIIKSYEDGACSYITKPVDYNEFVKVIENFERYQTIISKIT